MGTDLLDVSSELLLGSTQTLQRALQRPPTETLSANDAKDLLRHSQYVLTRIADMHDRSRNELAIGIEVSAFGQVCDDMKEVVEQFQAMNHALEGMIRQQQPSVRQRRRLAHLKVIEEETARILKSYQTWSVTFRQPPRPIDWAAVAEAEAAHARGEHRRTSEFETHLEERAVQ